MTIVKADSNVALSANDDVFFDDEACGNVVMSVTNGNETKALVEITLKSMEKEVIEFVIQNSLTSLSPTLFNSI